MSKAKGKGGKGKGKGKGGGKKKAAEEPAEEVPEEPPQTETEKRLAEQCRLLELQISEEQRLGDYFSQCSTSSQTELKDATTRTDVLKETLHTSLAETETLSTEQQVELNEYQNRVRNVLIEFQSEMTKARVDAETVLQSVQQTHRQEVHLEQMINRQYLRKQKEMQQRHVQLCEAIRKDNDSKLLRLRGDFERKMDALKAITYNKMSLIRTQNSLKREKMIKRVEAKKNAHTEQLIDKHKLELSEIQKYYSDITHSNLELIKSLKSRVTEAQVKERAKEQELLEMAHTNKHLSEPLKICMIRVEALTNQLDQYAKEKLAAQRLQQQVNKLKKSCDELQWKNYILVQKLNQIKEDSENIRKNTDQLSFSKLEKQNMYTTLVQDKVDSTKMEVAVLSGVLRVLESQYKR